MRFSRSCLLVWSLLATSCARDALPIGAAPDAGELPDCGAVRCHPPEAEAITGPDAHGCVQCLAAKSCGEGRANIGANCQYSQSYLYGLACDKSPACVLDCMARLIGGCTDVGCGFCETCDCGAVSTFEQCVMTCQK